MAKTEIGDIDDIGMLKAAGRFVYIDRVKKNPKFLADIPRTLGYVRRNLAKYPELQTLRKHLTPYVPELQ